MRYVEYMQHMLLPSVIQMINDVYVGKNNSK